MKQRKTPGRKRMMGLPDLYINSSIHVALAVVSLSIISGLHYGLELNPWLLSFTFFGSITGYNFVKYAGIAKLHHRSLARNLKLIQIFSFLSFIMLLLSIIYISTAVLWWTGIFALLTLLYALPVFAGRNLRSIAGMKIFIIAIVWAGVSAILPAVNHEIPVEYVLLETLQKFFFVLALILPFEIRDLKYDLEELGTLPQRVGVKGTKITGFLLLLLFLLIELIKDYASGSNP